MSGSPFLTDDVLWEEPKDRLDDLAGRIEQVKERSSQTYMMVSQLQGHGTRMDGRTARIEDKVDLIMRHLGISKQ